MNSSLGQDCQILASTGPRSPDLAIRRELEVFNTFLIPTKILKMSLYDQITNWDNLRLAYKKAAKGKRGKGPAARFEYRLEDNLAALQGELLDKTYLPGHYNSFYIHEPKRRLISAAPFRDRVVHHALLCSSRVRDPAILGLRRWSVRSLPVGRTS